MTEDAFEKWLINHNNQIVSKINEQINNIIKEISELEVQPETIIQGILDKTETIHKQIGFSSYSNWVQKNLPIRLEDTIKK